MDSVKTMLNRYTSFVKCNVIIRLLFLIVLNKDVVQIWTLRLLTGLFIPFYFLFNPFYFLFNPFFLSDYRVDYYDLISFVICFKIFVINVLCLFLGERLLIFNLFNPFFMRKFFVCI